MRTLVLAALLASLLAVPARAVTPSDRYAGMPSATGLESSSVSFESTRDSAPLSGWWFEGRPDMPVLVLFGRERGNMADLLASVVPGFVHEGFSVLTFDYRDFGPAGPGPADTLVTLAYASRWVNDGEGAVRFARTRAKGRPVFAWGQGLGGAVAVAVAARGRDNVDAVACEGLFRTLNELLRTSGLAQVPGARERHRFLVETGDEPGSAVARLVVPLHVTLAMKDEVWPVAVTQDVTRRSLSRIDRWTLPEAGHEGVELTPGYHERIGGWFRRIAAMIRAATPPPGTE
ncbi:MAG: serine aminopeptidase domain-containing protein [bacterium]